MATSDQVRAWYPESVLGFSDGRPVCDFRLESEGGPMATILVPTPLRSSGAIVQKVHAATLNYWRPLIQAMLAHNVGYTNLNASGTINCRCVNHAGACTKASTHAHGVSMDVLNTRDWSTAWANDVLSLRTTLGEPVFSNAHRDHPSGQYGHHFQVNVPRGRTVVGYDPTPPSEETMFARHGDKNSMTVEHWQQKLNRMIPAYAPGFEDLVVDGWYGDKTAAAVAEITKADDGTRVSDGLQIHANEKVRLDIRLIRFEAGI